MKGNGVKFYCSGFALWWEKFHNLRCPIREIDTKATVVIPRETPVNKGFQRLATQKALEFCSDFGDGQ